jgi:hypothetical protein
MAGNGVGHHAAGAPLIRTLIEPACPRNWFHLDG